jgi:toluene monooxygenase system ferredoxin subunit
MPHSAAPATTGRDTADMLGGVAFFSGFTAEQRRRMAASARLVKLRAGQQIYRVGEPSHVFYLLVEGSVFFSFAVGQRQAPAQVIGRGDVFGWAALVEAGTPRNGSAAAMTDCTALAFDGAELLAMADADHSFGYALMRALNKIITGTLWAFVAG